MRVVALLAALLVVPAVLAAPKPSKVRAVSVPRSVVTGTPWKAVVSVQPPARAYKAFHDSGGSFEELLLAIVRDPAFIERRKEL